MSKDLCEAFLAYMKLIQLRNAWVEDCKKIDDNKEYYKIIHSMARGFRRVWIGRTGLSFPTAEMADKFMKTFNDLLEVAKPLL